MRSTPRWLWNLIIGAGFVLGFWLILIFLGTICIVIGNKF